MKICGAPMPDWGPIMSRLDRTQGIPAGYVLHEDCRLLVPCARKRVAEKEALPPVQEPPKPPAPPAPSTPKPKSRSPDLVPIYSAEDVDQFERGLGGLAKSSDRRRACEALLVDLKAQFPVGYRKFVRVPRNFRLRLAILETEMPNFRHVILQIRLLLTLQAAGKKLLTLPPILLAGDPGVGKTYFATQFAKAMGVDSKILHMESATSSMLLAGLEQHYATASPGMVFDRLVKGSHANPILVLDELDKAASDARHPPVNALYQLLESHTARQFHDQSCLDVTLDASHINWIVTANDLKKIPQPLLTRMKVIHVPEPNHRERMLIAGHVYRDIRRDEAWGRRFEPALPERSAQLLAELPGSVRRMRSILRMAYAYALDRNSKAVEIRDLKEALMAELPAVDLENIPPQGHA